MASPSSSTQQNEASTLPKATQGSEQTNGEDNPCIFIPWLFLSTLGGSMTVDALLELTKFDKKLGYGVSFIIPFIFGMAHASFALLPWCSRKELSRLGSTRKIILQMIALQAAFLAKHFSPNSDPKVFQLLVCLSIEFYVCIKFYLVACYIRGVSLRDIFTTVTTQSLIYWTPYWASIGIYICFVGYKFWANDSNENMLFHKASEEDITVGVIPPQKMETQLQKKESDLLAIMIDIPQDNAQAASSTTSSGTHNDILLSIQNKI